MCTQALQRTENTAPEFFTLKAPPPKSLIKKKAPSSNTHGSLEFMTLYRNFSLGGFTNFQTVHDGKNQKMYMKESQGPQFFHQFLTIPPQFTRYRVSGGDFSKRVLYMSYIWPSQHIKPPMEGVGWLLEPHPLWLGNSSASTEELPSWHRQEGETPATTSTSSVAPLVAAELRRRIDVVDCTSMDANVNGMRHGDLERRSFFDTWIDVFFWGGHFFEWWLGEATVLIFFGVILGTLPELFVAVFMLKHSRNAMAAEVTSISIPTLWLIWRCTVQNSLNDYTPEVELT